MPWIRKPPEAMLRTTQILLLCCALAAGGCAGPWGLKRGTTDEDERRAMQYFIKAKVFEAQDNHLGAIVALRSAADLDPNSPTFYAQLAHNYQRIEDMRMAAHFARAGLALDPGRLPLRRSLIQLLEREGDHYGAIEQIEVLLQYEADNWPLYRHLAYLYLETGQAARIPPMFKGVLARADAPTAVRVDIAGVFARIGQKEEAERIYLQVLEREPDAEDAWLGLAELKLSQGHRNEAMVIYRRAAAQLPDSSMIFYYLARLLATEHDLEEILAEEDAGLLYRLGLALSEAGKHDQAKLVFERIVGMQPQTVEHWLDLARYYIYLENNDQAYAVLAKAVAAMPDSSEIYLFWGTALEGQGRFDEAIGIYRRGLEVLPASEELYLYWGIALEQQDAWGEAVEVYRRAIAVLPGYGGLHVRWSNTQRRQQPIRCTAKLFCTGVSRWSAWSAGKRRSSGSNGRWCSNPTSHTRCFTWGPVTSRPRATWVQRITSTARSKSSKDCWKSIPTILTPSTILAICTPTKVPGWRKRSNYCRGRFRLIPTTAPFSTVWAGPISGSANSSRPNAT